MMKMLRRLFSRSAKHARVGTMTLTLDDLINEGRALERPCLVLRANGPGEIAAVWHTPVESEAEQAFLRQWITIDTSFIPGFDVSEGRFLSVFTDADMSGQVELLDALPVGQPLYAQAIPVLPPIDAVIACGSARIDHWLAANHWQRSERYNDNFRDRALVEQYERMRAGEYPLFSPEEGFYAALGGWHLPHCDDDWHDLIERQLLVTTIFDAEPWVEAWLFGPGFYKVIPRIT
jgi:hypothetical protein